MEAAEQAMFIFHISVTTRICRMWASVDCVSSKLKVAARSHLPASPKRKRYGDPHPQRKTGNDPQTEPGADALQPHRRLHHLPEIRQLRIAVGLSIPGRIGRSLGRPSTGTPVNPTTPYRRDPTAVSAAPDANASAARCAVSMPFVWSAPPLVACRSTSKTRACSRMPTAASAAPVPKSPDWRLAGCRRSLPRRSQRELANIPCQAECPAHIDVPCTRAKRRSLHRRPGLCSPKAPSRFLWATFVWLL